MEKVCVNRLRHIRSQRRGKTPAEGTIWRWFCGLQQAGRVRKRKQRKKEEEEKDEDKEGRRKASIK